MKIFKLVLFFLVLAQVLAIKQRQIYHYTQLYFWIYVSVTAALLALAALCSGLTVGYTSFDSISLELLKKNGSEWEKMAVRKIQPIINNHHVLLSTLLIANALAMEALPIVINKITGQVAAIIISSMGLLVVGQIIPQALCTGPQQLQIAYAMSPIINWMIWLLSPIVNPIAKFLDNWLGESHDKKRFQTDQLKAILKLHKQKTLGYTNQQIDMMLSTLALKSMEVSSSMIPLNQVTAFNQDTVLNLEVLYKIASSNFSCVPIFKGSIENPTGYINTKQLISFFQQKERPVLLKNSCRTRPYRQVEDSQCMLNILGIFKQNRTKLLFVKRQERVVGIITLKQVFQQITLKKFSDGEMHHLSSV